MFKRTQSLTNASLRSSCNLWAVKLNKAILAINPNLEPNTKSIGWRVAELRPFEVYHTLAGERTPETGDCMWFLQRGSIACYAKHCISYRKFCPTVCHTLVSSQNDLSYDTGSSLEDGPVTLVSSWLTSARNSKGNIGSEGTEWVGWEKLAIFSQ